MNNALAGYLRLATRGILHRKLRATLTSIGIVIAVAVVVALVLLGNGLREAVSAQLRQFGTDLIFVFPGDVSNPFSALVGRNEFRGKDVDAMRNVAGVAMVMPTVEGRLVKAEFRGEKKAVSLHAQPWELIQSIFEESQGFRMREGRWPEKEGAHEVVLGASFAANAFKEPVRVNDELVIRGRRLLVAGILEDLGEQNHDNTVFVSLELLRILTGQRDGYTVVIVKAEAGQALDALAERIGDALRRQKGLPDFSVLTAEKAASIAGSVIGIIELVLFLIAAVAVFVGGIGVMNTMYTSVLERTRDIGIMKAVGAKHRQVLLVFLIEAGVIGLAGGAVGTALGAAVAEYVAFLGRGGGFRFLTISIDLKTVFAIIAVSVSVGVVAGTLPALQAARLRPADALKYR